MNPTLVATLAGLITALCWGVSDWLSARSSKKLGVLEVNFAVQLISILLMAVLWLFAGLHVDSAEQVIRIGLGSILITSGYLLFVKALSDGAVGIVSPLSNIYPLFTIVLTTIFLDTHVAAGQLFAMVIIVAGAATLAYEPKTSKKPSGSRGNQIAWAFAAAAVWGFGFFVLDPVVSQVSWQTISILGEFFSFVFAFAVLIAAQPRRAKAAIERSFQHIEPFLVGAIGTLGIVAIYFGSTKVGNVLIPTVLSAAGPLVASVCAAIFDHEKLGAFKRIGAAVVVAGIVLLNLA